jgi:hypothetical protein
MELVLKKYLDRLIELGVDKLEALDIVKNIATESYEFGGENTYYDEIHGYDKTIDTAVWVARHLGIIDTVKSEKLVTNFSQSRLDAITKATEMFSVINSDHGLYVENDAFDSIGNKIPGHYALYRTEPVDLSKFWRIVEVLELENK